MRSEEDKLDEFLEEILSDVGIATPPSRRYTNEVMLKVSKLDLSSAKNKKRIITVGLLVYLMVSMVLYLLWQNGTLDSIIEYFGTLKGSLPEIISFQNLGFIVGGFLFYLIAVRIGLTVLLMRGKNGGIQYR